MGSLDTFVDAELLCGRSNGGRQSPRWDTEGASACEAGLAGPPRRGGWAGGHSVGAAGCGGGGADAPVGPRAAAIAMDSIGGERGRSGAS
jgi:hypothetical protein